MLTLKPADKTTCQKLVQHGCPDYTLLCDLFETNLATGQHAASSTATVSTATAPIATPLQVEPQEDEDLYDSDLFDDNLSTLPPLPPPNYQSGYTPTSTTSSSAMSTPLSRNTAIMNSGPRLLYSTTNKSSTKEVVGFQHFQQ
ncbi:UNVERIFIED_CONTAM: hypothetical protein HDU68_006211, partial [Siphonaria sp. JEL0065]